MIVNVADLKQRFNEALTSRYDHRMLNLDHPTFQEAVPTVELMAGTLMSELSRVALQLEVDPFACHLALIRGLNPDAPRRLKKVTRTL